MYLEWRQGENKTLDHTDFINEYALTRDSRFNVLPLAAKSSSNSLLIQSARTSTQRDLYIADEVEVPALPWLICLMPKNTGMLEKIYHVKLHTLHYPTEYIPHEGSEGSSSPRCRDKYS